MLGSTLVWRATTLGAGISPDSTVYISMARAYLNAFGFQFVLQSGGDFPPFYPALLALGGALAGDPATAARPLNTLLFGANIFLVGWILKRILPNSFFAPLFGAALMVSSFTMLTIHAMAWSEPTFLFFGLSGMIALASYIERPRWWLLLVAGAAMGLAAIDRYVGIALTATGLAALLVLGGGTLRHKLVSTVVFVFVSALPLALVMVQRPTRRLLTFQIPPAQYFLDGFNNISIWMIPPGVPLLTRYRPWVVIVLTLVFVLAVAWVSRRQIQGRSLRSVLMQLSPLLLLAALFGVTYAAVNVFAKIFLGPALTLHDRALSPLFVAGVILFISGAALLYSHLEARVLVRIGAAATVIAILWLSFSFAWNYVERSRVQGLGYASIAWQSSPTIARIKALPPELVIYSNGSDAVYFLASRRVVRLPNKVDKMNMLENQIYLESLAKVGRELEAGRAVVVWFNNFPDRWYQPSDQELQDNLTLRLVSSEADGVIFR